MIFGGVANEMRHAGWAGAFETIYISIFLSVPYCLTDKTIRYLSVSYAWFGALDHFDGKVIL